MKMERNAEIIAHGTIKAATKLQVLTIGIGYPHLFEEVEGVIEHRDGGTFTFTKESPEGIIYPQDREAVVRVLGDRVLIDGRYDIYCPAPEKLPKLLSNPCDLQEVCTAQQLAELYPILSAASAIKPSIAPAEPGRRVIVITPQLIDQIGADGTDSKGAYLLERDEWDDNPDSELTKLYSGDIFLVSDETTAKGYRIGREEFELTHKFDE